MIIILWKTILGDLAKMNKQEIEEGIMHRFALLDGMEIAFRIKEKGDYYAITDNLFIKIPCGKNLKVIENLSGTAIEENLESWIEKAIAQKNLIAITPLTKVPYDLLLNYHKQGALKMAYSFERSYKIVATWGIPYEEMEEADKQRKGCIVFAKKELI